MRTSSEINKELEKIMMGADLSNQAKYTAHAIAGQALAWVLGDELTASEMIENEFSQE